MACSWHFRSSFVPLSAKRYNRIQEFELAAEERYYEALELMTSGRSGGGVYLMGYVGEIILKVAYFRFDGARPGDLIEPRLAPAWNRAKRDLPGIQRESYHSLSFWALLLIKARQKTGRLWPDNIQAPFRQRTRRLYQNWWVNMRYLRDISNPLDMRSVYDDVTWLLKNRAAFWS